MQFSDEFSSKNFAFLLLFCLHTTVLAVMKIIMNTDIYHHRHKSI